MGLQLIKLGGSAITHDDGAGFFYEENVRRIAAELRPYAAGCILVHGTGHVGKRPAVAHAYVDSGIIEAARTRLALAIRADLHELNGRVVNALTDAGIATMPLDTARWFTRDGTALRQASLADSLRKSAQEGVVPVFYGDLVPQGDGSFRVVSSDTILSVLVNALQPDATHMFTNVDGVYGVSPSDPETHGDVIRVLTPDNLEDVHRSTSDDTDVSGGMTMKIAHAMEISRISGSCTIASGVRPTVVSKVLAGDDVACTRVRQREQSQPVHRCATAILLAGIVCLAGCIGSPTGRFADGLANGVGRLPDAALVEDGLPACILMLEGLLSSSPDNPRLLESAATLYSAYGRQLATDEPDRAALLTERALGYVLDATQAWAPGLRQARTMRFRDLETILQSIDPGDLDALFTLGSVWVDWIRVRGDDIKAIGDLPRVEQIMTRVVELDASYRNGAAHLYLAMLAMHAGEADKVIEAHFAASIATAGEDNLMPHVLHAIWLERSGKREDARERLRKIVDGDLPGVSGYALMNRLALDKAQQALDEM